MTLASATFPLGRTIPHHVRFEGDDVDAHGPVQTHVTRAGAFRFLGLVRPQYGGTILDYSRCATARYRCTRCRRSGPPRASARRG